MWLEVVIDSWNKNQLLYRYIVDKGKLVLLDSSNIDKYVGTKVKLRSPVYCIGDKLCSKCAGSMFYKLGIENVGLTTSRVATTLLNLNMKKFHNSTANISKIDINKISI